MPDLPAPLCAGCGREITDTKGPLSLCEACEDKIKVAGMRGQGEIHPATRLESRREK